ncbi:MAG: hypothetical protein KDA39_10840 [Hyphomonas sp.]|nr:hypothetical protein [Hyphomonas sp.]
MMKAPVLILVPAALALAGLGGCTSEDLAAFADGMNEVADDMAVTMTSVPQWSCGYNAHNDLVCDDNGDGYADRYGDPAYDTISTGAYYGSPYASSGLAPRINGYGEAYVYDDDCTCWVREPSLDELPDDHGHGHHHHDDDDWDDE